MAPRVRDGAPSAAAPILNGPSTPRGQRTRRLLIDAAREVFEQRRYLDTTVAQIVERAGVAHGTFYIYFPSKEAVFREVALDVHRALLAPTATDDVRPEDPVLRIERANRRYLESYMAHAPLMAVIEQVATFNDELLAIRKEIRRAFVERSRRSIARLQKEGRVTPDLDPLYTANALGAMVDRFAYVWLVLGEPFELDDAVYNLTAVWARALGLDTAGLVRPRRRRRR